jgi:hypothetical protein
MSKNMPRFKSVERSGLHVIPKKSTRRRSFMKFKPFFHDNLFTSMQQQQTHKSSVLFHPHYRECGVSCFAVTEGIRRKSGGEENLEKKSGRVENGKSESVETRRK